MKKYLYFAIILCLGGCQKVDSRWLENTEGNKFEIISGRAVSHRFVFINNQLRTWNGKYVGGEEQIEARKKLLISLSEKEASRICGEGGFTKDEHPSFVMKDTGGHSYGGGILGEMLAHMFTNNANIPISSNYYFSCLDEEDLKELPERL